MLFCRRRVRVVSLSSWLKMTARRSSKSSTPSSSCVLVISSKLLYEHAHAVNDAAESRGGREYERAARRDEHGGRDHRRQDGQR
jgi:hypothetical protein